jgi:hypothetical protein
MAFTQNTTLLNSTLDIVKNCFVFDKADEYQSLAQELLEASIPQRKEILMEFIDPKDPDPEMKSSVDTAIADLTKLLDTPSKKKKIRPTPRAASPTRHKVQLNFMSASKAISAHKNTAFDMDLKLHNPGDTKKVSPTIAKIGEQVVREIADKHPEYTLAQLIDDITTLEPGINPMAMGSILWFLATTETKTKICQEFPTNSSGHRKPSKFNQLQKHLSAIRKGEIATSLVRFGNTNNVGQTAKSQAHIELMEPFQNTEQDLLDTFNTLVQQLQDEGVEKRYCTNYATSLIWGFMDRASVSF